MDLLIKISFRPWISFCRLSLKAWIFWAKFHTEYGFFAEFHLEHGFFSKISFRSWIFCRIPWQCDVQKIQAQRKRKKCHVQHEFYHKIFLHVRELFLEIFEKLQKSGIPPFPQVIVFGEKERKFHGNWNYFCVFVSPIMYIGIAQTACICTWTGQTV